MRRHQPAKHSEPSPNIEKLLEAANSASQTVAALHVAFMAFAAYLGVIIWGTTHEALLRISPVKLPILDVDLPLTTFYGGTPWLLILMHFNLLMQLELLSRKLWNLDSELPNTLASQQIRDRLFIFPFTHLIAGRSSVRLIRWLLSLVVGITVIALPLLLLLAAQIRFLPFHDEGITWSQRIAVWIDAIMLLGLWPLIASSNDSARQWWRNLSYRLFGYWLVWLRVLLNGGWNRLARMTNLHKITPNSMPTIGAEAKGMFVLLASVLVVFPLSIIAVIPGNITVETYYQPTKDSQIYFEDWLVQHIFGTWLSVVNIEENVRTCRPLIPAPPYKQPNQKQELMLTPTCRWFDLGGLPRNLDLKEAQLVPKDVSISLLTRAIDPDKSVRDEAFKEFDGLKLKDRDLRFANMSGVTLPKADLRNVKLQGANMGGAKLQGANLRGASLQGAVLLGASLQGAVLIEAILQGADLSWARLQGADLRAILQGADLRGASLQGADLKMASLQGADLSEASLQGAVLSWASLQGADLSWASLQGADLRGASLQGAVLIEASLQGADLRGASLQDIGVRWSRRQGLGMSWARSLQVAEHSGADLSGAELSGINWSTANLDNILMTNNLMSAWDTQQEAKLEAELKPLLNKDRLNDLQRRMKRATKNMLPGQPSSQTDCYSDNPKLLECNYHQPTQLDAYRSALHPKLIELACSDAEVAMGIARRSFIWSESQKNIPDFGLAAAILKALDTPNPCEGLAALPEETRQSLREAAEKQEKIVKSK